MWAVRLNSHESSSGNLGRHWSPTPVRDEHKSTPLHVGKCPVGRGLRNSFKSGLKAHLGFDVDG